MLWQSRAWMWSRTWVGNRDESREDERHDVEAFEESPLNDGRLSGVFLKKVKVSFPISDSISRWVQLQTKTFHLWQSDNLLLGSSHLRSKEMFLSLFLRSCLVLRLRVFFPVSLPSQSDCRDSGEIKLRKKWLLVGWSERSKLLLLLLVFESKHRLSDSVNNLRYCYHPGWKLNAKAFRRLASCSSDASNFYPIRLLKSCDIERDNGFDWESFVFSWRTSPRLHLV